MHLSLCEQFLLNVIISSTTGTNFAAENLFAMFPSDQVKTENNSIDHLDAALWQLKTLDFSN